MHKKFGQPAYHKQVGRIEYEAVADEWNHSYSREKAVYPVQFVRENKFWVNVARVDNTLGDRKLLPTRYGSFE